MTKSYMACHSLTNTFKNLAQLHIAFVTNKPSKFDL